MRVTRKIELDYGHTLPDHYSFCSEIHGHRAIVEATVIGKLIEDPGASQHGMVFDFQYLKDAMVEYIHDILDHGFAVWEEDDVTREFIEERNTKVLVLEHPPTAEVLAQWAFNQIADKLPDGISLESIRWYETPNNWADYTFMDGPLPKNVIAEQSDNLNKKSLSPGEMSDGGWL